MSDPSSGRRFRGSLGVSSALHLALFALVVPIVATDNVDLGRLGGASQRTESTTLSIITIEHHLPPPHRARVAVAVRPATTTNAAPAPQHSVKPQRQRVAPAPANHLARTTVWRSILAHAAHVRMRVAVLMPTTAPEVAAAPALSRRIAPPGTPVPVPSASAVPTASPSAAPDDRRVAEAGIDVPPGGWGQSFEKPLIADDSALAALRAKFHVSAAIVVGIDEAGHAVSVSLPSGLSDTVRADLERSIREMRYVPAECNGLRCDGTLQITL